MDRHELKIDIFFIAANLLCVAMLWPSPWIIANAIGAGWLAGWAFHRETWKKFRKSNDELIEMMLENQDKFVSILGMMAKGDGTWTVRRMDENKPDPGSRVH